MDSREGKGEEGPENEVDSNFKNIILLDMADSIPFLVPSQFQELIFPHITRPTIPARAFFLCLESSFDIFFIWLHGGVQFFLFILKAAAFDVGNMEVCKN